MRNLIILLAIVLAGPAASAQELLNNAPSLNGSNAEIAFESDSHEFGKIKQGVPVSYEFKFKNTGIEPLLINNAVASCGCTVPDWPKHPVKPGESATITVKYDAKKAGSFNKIIKIHSNARNGAVKEITISGVVQGSPEAATGK